MRERHPENGPRMRSRSFRGGRSQDFSVQEDGAAPKGRGGVHRRHSDCLAPLFGCAAQIDIRWLEVVSFGSDSRHLAARLTHGTSGPNQRTHGVPRGRPSPACARSHFLLPNQRTLGFTVLKLYAEKRSTFPVNFRPSMSAGYGEKLINLYALQVGCIVKMSVDSLILRRGLGGSGRTAESSPIPHIGEWML